MEYEVNPEFAVDGPIVEIAADDLPALDACRLKQHEKPEAANLTSGRRSYDPTLWGKGVRASKDLAKEMEVEFKKRINLNPAKYAGLNMKVSVSARPRSTPGSHLVTKELIRHILTVTGAKHTQTECRLTIQARYPDHAIAKDWTKPLPRWVIDFMKKHVASTSAPFNTLVVRPGMSYRDLHAAARQAANALSETCAIYDAKVVVTEDAVVINGVEFKISEAKTGKYKYRFMRAAMPTFLNALCKR